jgi:hypothetical protein
LRVPDPGQYPKMVVNINKNHKKKKFHNFDNFNILNLSVPLKLCFEMPFLDLLNLISSGKRSDLKPDPELFESWVRIRNSLKSRIRIRNENFRIHNTGDVSNFCSLDVKCRFTATGHLQVQMRLATEKIKQFPRNFCSAWQFFRKAQIFIIYGSEKEISKRRYFSVEDQ